MLGAIPNRWFSGLPQRAPQLVSAVLAPLVAAEFVRLALLVPSLVGIGSLQAKPASSLNPGNQSIQPLQIDIERIVGAHLFGVISVGSDGEPAAGGAVPPTSSKLTLTGTIATSDPKQGSAIVSDNESGKSAMYKTGSDLKGASLYSVYVDRIILKRDGRFEVLYMPRAGRTPPSPQRISTDPAAEARSEPGSPQIAEGHGVSEALRVGAAVGAGGQPHGFRVFPSRDRATFTSAGLHPGDVVIAVNGTPVGEQTAASLANLSRATLTIERFGRTAEVTVDVGQAGTAETSVPTAPTAPAPVATSVDQ